MYYIVLNNMELQLERCVQRTYCAYRERANNQPSLNLYCKAH